MMRRVDIPMAAQSLGKQIVESANCWKRAGIRPYAHAIAINSQGKFSTALRDKVGIANIYVLTHNSVAITYQHGVLTEILQNKKKYKFCAGIVHNMMKWQNDYDMILKGDADELGDQAYDQLNDICDTFQDEFSAELAQLQKSVEGVFEDHGCNDKLLAWLLVAHMMVENAALTYRIQMNWLADVDVKIVNVQKWMNAQPLLNEYTMIERRLGIEQICEAARKDLTVMCKLNRVKKVICSGKWIAHHMGLDETVPEEESFVRDIEQHDNTLSLC